MIENGRKRNDTRTSVDGADWKSLFRRIRMRGGCTDSELKKAIYQVIWNKPVSHNFYEAKTEQDEIRGMSQIGG